MIRPAYWLWPLFWLVFAMPAGAADVVDTINTGGTDFFDNWMYSAQSLNNNGAHADLNFGQQRIGEGAFRTIVFFSLQDFTNIDSVVACTLRGEASFQLQNNRDSVYIYRVLIHLDSNWTGAKNGGAADSGETSWLYRMYTDGDLDTVWNSNGCSGAGSDYVNRVLAAADMSGLSEGNEVKWAIDRTVIDSMYDGDLNNYGFLMAANNQATDSSRSGIYAVDNATASNRPLIILAYDTIATAATATVVGPTTIGPTVIGP